MSVLAALEDNECEILWNVDESHKVREGYSYYRSPPSESKKSSGTTWALVLQSANSTQYPVYDPDFKSDIYGKAWRLDLILPFHKSFNKVLPIDYSKNLLFFSYTYQHINTSDYAFDVVLKLKKEMNSPPLYLPCHAKRYLRKIRIVVSVVTRVVSVQKTCLLAHEKMASYLAGLYTDERFSDIKIQVNSVVFPAHMNVLSAHSKVFEAMFSSKMAETETGTVVMKDLNLEGVSKLLEFMYTQKDPNLDTFQLAEDVYRAAHMYQVDHLLYISTTRLGKLLDETNVLDLLVLGHTFSDALLKTKAISFITGKPNLRLDSEKCRAVIMENPDLFEFLFECLRRCTQKA